jgi:hypothetical protein
LFSITRAGVTGEQRNEGFAIQTRGAHHAVGDQRGAREVTGIFQNSDKQKQQQDLRQKDQH